MMCFMYIFFVCIFCTCLFLVVSLPACDRSLSFMVSCLILCVVPPGVYIVYYFKNWVVSFVMYVVHMDSFFTERSTSLMYEPRIVHSSKSNIT
jgi:putative effector of murein hydrolase LrgA (UPF0299 family)